MLTIGSVCSGAGTAELIAEDIGLRHAWCSEVDLPACAVLAHRFGTSAPENPPYWLSEKELSAWKKGVKEILWSDELRNIGDMTVLPDLIREGKVEAPDIFCGGTPCFTAGHMVLAEQGYIPIEEIRPGMMVMTHKGRLREVLRTGSKMSLVGMLRGVGMPDGICCTPGHPFRSVEWRNQNTKRDNAYAKVEHVGEPEWTRADEMTGKQWCSLRWAETDPDAPVFFSDRWTAPQAMLLAGYYLGDGHVATTQGKNKKSLVLSLNGAKARKLSEGLGKELTTLPHGKGVFRVTIHDTRLCDWLLREFGAYSHGKRVPAWAMTDRDRHWLLGGYVETDGHRHSNGGFTANSVSRALAYGIRELSQACGYVASVSVVRTPDTCVIEGRTVNQRDYWSCRAVPAGISRKSRPAHGMILRRCNNYERMGIDTVYNIEVDEDHSYILDGAIVHNCQAFSVAGKRGGLNDRRGNLTLTFVEICNAIDDIRLGRGQSGCSIVWENVPGVTSDKTNAFGCFLGALAGFEAAVLSPGGKFAGCGVVVGPRRRVAWGTFDSQFMGVPQRRRRVFVIATPVDADPVLGPGALRPELILALGQSLRRDTPTRRGKGQVVASAPGSAAAESVAFTHSGYSNQPAWCTGDRTDCLSASGHSDGAHQGILVAQTQAAAEECISFAQNQCGELRIGDIANTLNTNSNASGRNTPTVAQECVSFVQNTRDEVRLFGGDGLTVGALSAQPGMKQQAYIAQEPISFGWQEARNFRAPTDGTTNTLTKNQAVAIGSHWDDPTNPHPCLNSGHDSGGIAASNQELFSQRGAGLVCGIDKASASAFAGLSPTPETDLGQGMGPCVDAQWWDGKDIADTLTKSNAGGGQRMPDKQNLGAAIAGGVLRRLLPIEAERLQGLPDSWTLVPFRGKPMTDGHRYKICGNGWAYPVARWVIEGVALAMGHRTQPRQEPEEKALPNIFRWEGN